MKNSSEEINRMCDEAFSLLKGISEDAGFAVAVSVFRAQVAAFVALAGNEYQSNVIGAKLAEAIVSEIRKTVDDLVSKS